MKRTLLLTAVLALVALMAVSTAAAQDGITVNVSVEGEQASDGERIQVKQQEVAVGVTVESENELNTLEASLHNETVIAGINGTEYSTSQILEIRPGSNTYSVVAKDLEGNLERFSVDLYREPVTVREVREAVERLEDRRNALENDVERLEKRRDELTERRDNLSSRLKDTGDGEGGNGGGDDSGSEGLPGFTAVVTLVAVVLVAAGRAHN